MLGRGTRATGHSWGSGTELLLLLLAFSCPINAMVKMGKRHVCRVCVYVCALSEPLSRGLGKHMSTGRNQFGEEKENVTATGCIFF